VKLLKSSLKLPSPGPEVRVYGTSERDTDLRGESLLEKQQEDPSRCTTQLLCFHMMADATLSSAETRAAMTGHSRTKRKVYQV
jgi:hypothetical protein